MRVHINSKGKSSSAHSPAFYTGLPAGLTGKCADRLCLRKHETRFTEACSKT